MHQLTIDNSAANKLRVGTVPNDSGSKLSPAVPVETWLEQRSGTAVSLRPGDDHRQLYPLLSELEVITIEFTDLNDGRVFTMGRALREAGFSGELRATGSFLQDQLQYLRRCGFNAFDLPSGTTPEAASHSLYEFSVSYQAAQDDPLPLFRRTR